MPVRPTPRGRVSVLVPAKDEAENLPLFMELAAAAFAERPASRYEVVVIDDGSVDDTLARAPGAGAAAIRSCAPCATARGAESPTRSAPDT